MGAIFSKKIQSEAHKKLWSLDLSHSRLSTIPLDALVNARDIRRLNLAFNRELIFRIKKLEISVLDPELFDQLINLKVLDISSNALDNLPNELFQNSLEGINMSHNPLCSLKPNLFMLQNLTILSIGHCQLSSMPDDLTSLTLLRTLIACSNRFEKIPENIGDMKSLQSLDLNHNLISHLPASFGDLESLIWLNLSYNKIKCLPDSFSKLSNLKELGLGANALMAIPDLGAFPHLTTLSAFDNNLSQITWSQPLIHLNRLELSSNKLSRIPESLFAFPNLGFLNLSGNEIRSLTGNSFLQSNQTVSKLYFLDISENQLPYLTFSIIRSLNEIKYLNTTGNDRSHLRKITPKKMSMPTLQNICLNEILAQNQYDDLAWHYKPTASFSHCDNCGRAFILQQSNLEYPRACASIKIRKQLIGGTLALPVMYKFDKSACLEAFFRRHDKSDNQAQRAIDIP